MGGAHIKRRFRPEEGYERSRRKGRQNLKRLRPIKGGAKAREKSRALSAGAYVMETVLTMLFLLGVLVARANYLYGRSAYEAGEYGGPFVPRWLQLRVQ